MSTSTSEMEPTEADAGLSKNIVPPPNHEDEDDAPPASSSIPSAAPICPLCYDEDLTVILSACQHCSCMTCLVRWMNGEECSGRATGPTCPFCRIVISDEDVVRVLGRPFQPREVVSHTEPPTNDEVDEFTLHWINEHTVQCAMCGYRIEKSDGCDKVECLCGYRFCYRCGAADAICDCNLGHIFLDEDLDLCVHAAPLRDVNGVIDLGLCIRRRQVGLVRSIRRHGEEWERWEYWTEDPAVCTFNGRWLFSSKTKSRCIAMLTQQLGHRSITSERESRYRREYEMQNASWLFLRRGADTKAMHQFVVGTTREAYWEDHWGRWSNELEDILQYERSLKGREVRLKRRDQYAEKKVHWYYAAKTPSLCTFNGRWIFSSKNRSRCIGMLRQQLEQERIVFERKEQKACESQEEMDLDAEEKAHWNYAAKNPSLCTFNGRWMFSPKNSSRCIGMLRQQLEQERIMLERKEQKACRSQEELCWSKWKYLIGWGYMYIEEYRVVYDQLLKSRDGIVQEHLNYFSVVLDMMEDSMQRIFNEAEYLDLDDPGHYFWPWWWDGEFSEIQEYENSCCRCRNHQLFTCNCGCLISAFCDCGKHRELTCNCGYLADGSPFDLAHVKLRKMTGTSRKKTRRETARKSSRKSSRSNPRSKMSPAVARWKRRNAQLAWSED